MYDTYFGFRELPFNNTPDPRFFYSTPDHEEALASLIYGIKERKGFILLTGEVGAGKTLVTRMMLRRFGTNISFANINHALQSPGDLMEAILTEFELPFQSDSSPTQLVRVLHDFLLAQFSQNRPVVLVLDEAQNLPIAGFEQLRMIGNLEADDAKLLQIAIVGQPELQRLFLTPEMRQLRQRIFRSFHLPALSQEHTQGYITYRLGVASDADRDIFDKGAIQAIHEFSGGVPRVINTICDNALLSAYSADRKTIDRAFIETVSKQMMLTDERQAVELPPPPVNRLLAQPVENSTHSAATAHPPRQHPMAQDPGDVSTVQRSRRSKSTTLTQPSTEPVMDGARHNSGLSEKKVGAVAAQLAALERKMSQALSDTSEGRFARSSLESLVHQTRGLLRQVETSSASLSRKHAQLRVLSTTVKTVVRDLRQLLDRGQQAVLYSRKAERGACAVRRRLETQTERSLTVFHSLDKLLARMAPADAPTVLQPVLLKEGTTLKADITPATASMTRIESNFGPVKAMCRETQASVADLRHLAQAAQKDVPSRGKASATPIARLANQVESLLDMIEPTLS